MKYIQNIPVKLKFNLIYHYISFYLHIYCIFLVNISFLLNLFSDNNPRKIENAWSI